MFRTSKHIYMLISMVFMGMLGILVPLRVGGNVHTLRITYLFTSPNGLPCQRPCLLGVRPRAMTFRQATNILRRHPLVEWMSLPECERESGYCAFRLRGFGSAIGTLVSEQTVGLERAYRVADIYLTFNLPASEPIVGVRPTMGEIIAGLGAPSYIFPHYNCCAAEDVATAIRKYETFGPTFGLLLYYAKDGIEVADKAKIVRGRYFLTPASEVYGIRVFVPYSICDRNRPFWKGWLGFHPLEVYYTTPSHTC